jgi:hypothetical protein
MHEGEALYSCNRNTNNDTAVQRISVMIHAKTFSKHNDDDGDDYLYIIDAL